MKKLLTILLASIAFASCAQTRIGTGQIQDGAITAPKISNGAVTQEKLSSTTLRPVSGGVLPGPELTFGPEPWKSYTLTMSADVNLVLAASGNVSYSKIDLIVTGDGSHVMTFPATWTVSGTFDPDQIQVISLEYIAGYVTGVIKPLAVNVSIEATLQSAEVLESGLNSINLLFDNMVQITSDGWTVTASGGAVTILLVSGNGTTTPSFTISRSIAPGETVTISYSTTGNTTSSTGNEIEAITNQAVIVPPPVQADNCPGCTKFVDDDAADDIAAGTIGDPYKTIQAAMTAAVSGDVIGVRAGTYRETIVCKTNVTVREYGGETAIVSGFNVLSSSGWTVHSGNIYKKTVTLPVNGYNTSTSRIAENSLNTTIFANQILRNGVMMVEARFPNITVAGTAGTDDYFDRTKYKNGVDYTNGFGVTRLVDASMPNSSSLNLNGATLVCNGWFAQETRTISNHTGTQFDYANIWDANLNGGAWTRARYYITNKLGLLDAAAEWHYESGTLYFWQPGGGSPTGTIEYKARNWGFDARGKQNVKIIGLTFIGCEPFVGDGSSTDAVIDNIDVTFQNHHVRHDVVEWQGVGMSKQFGIKLIGANSVIKNSRLSYGGSTGIWLGNNCRAENNLIHDYGYVGYFAIPINLWGPDAQVPVSDNQVITRNTIYRTGRSSFEFGYNFNQAPGNIAKHFNVEVSYNDFSEPCMVSSDCGATYTWGQCDLKGLNMHHNWVHDIHPREQAQGGINVGFYFDQATGPGKIHHNVTWNCVDGDIYHETTNDWRPTRAGVSTPWNNPDTRLDIYNNTFWTPSVSSGGGLYYSPASYRTYVASTLDVQRNNIYRIPLVVAWQAGNNGNTSNSILSTTNPLFVGSGAITNPQSYFQLQSGSPARNIGLANYAGATGSINDGSTDAGAYKYNNIDDVWIPGYTGVPVDDEGELTIDNALSPSNAYSGTWNHYNNLSWNNNHINNTFSVTYDAAASLTTTFTGNRVEWWTEKRENHGIVEVRIDGVRQDCNTGVGGTQDCDLYANTQANGSQMVFSKDLSQGVHTVSIHATNTNNASATGTITQVVHDAFKVTSE